jgi:Ca2+-binding RTX toxin-like protein
VGTANADNMQGSQRNDIMRGYDGNDKMIGGLGNDTMHGANGNDRIEGRLGNDLLNGGKGNDTILNAEGADDAYGASGDDVIRAYRDDQEDFVSCGTGYDIADVQAGDNVDGTNAAQLVGTSVTSCERIFVNGILVVNTPRV